MSARSGCQRAADEEILGFALGKNGVVVTLDADFHAILAVSGAVGPSVIRIRIQGLRAMEIVERLLLAATRFGSELEVGSLVTVKARKTTCHRAPDRPFGLKRQTLASLSFPIGQAGQAAGGGNRQAVQTMSWKIVTISQPYMRI
jgi:predicted nuclease of predicted toxin-antitoxin system